MMFDHLLRLTVRPLGEIVFRASSSEIGRPHRVLGGGTARFPARIADMRDSRSREANGKTLRTLAGEIRQ
jgi:hypothetical protein